MNTTRLTVAVLSLSAEWNLQGVLTAKLHLLSVRDSHGGHIVRLSVSNIVCASSLSSEAKGKSCDL